MFEKNNSFNIPKIPLVHVASYPNNFTNAISGACSLLVTNMGTP